MRIAIVGHGPSLKGAGLGKKIDACDKVIRLKNCAMLMAEPHDFGTKTDAHCTSTETLTNLRKIKSAECWGYAKKGGFAQARVRQAERRLGKKIHIPLEVCALWNEAFRLLGAKHPNVSTGIGALIIALDRYKPEVAYLAGFDKVLNPETEGYQCTVPTEWNANGTKDTGHDWKKERELLGYLATHYQTEISDLAGLHLIQPGRV
jgi:hypothetical protein